MKDRHMGRCCNYSKECPVYQGLIPLKHPLFLVKNIYCNNGQRWWSKCQLYNRMVKGEDIDETMVPAEDLRQ